ncbi:MAG: NPCBM/NEW2 domain-containing protein [Pirellulales bacterium]|nr:NPCBM/NEW2 domain-containing protein [Pirellulales bacterium]
MNKHFTSSIAFVLFAVLTASPSLRAGGIVPLGSLDLSKIKQGWGAPKIDKSVMDGPLTIGGKTFACGVGTHAESRLYIKLDGGSSRFTAKIGVDDNRKDFPASVEFRVYADGRMLYKSGPMKPGDEAKAVDVDLRGAKNMLLFVGSAGNGVDHDHADWADAQFTVAGAKPQAVAPPAEVLILTPQPSPQPRINSPAVYGCRPGNPFIYRIPTSGKRPMTFAADNLPAGLNLDAKNGIITGVNPPRGEYVVTFRAANDLGSCEKKFKIVSGDRLALTPPMGWNDWYGYFDGVTDRLMREAADKLVESGLADAGYQYVGIDDCWMNAPADSQHVKDPLRRGPLRDADGNIMPNKHFPDMKALTDYIHAHGLKAAIYTSPGPMTCAGYGGSYQHEERDARQFADWGFDLLKYDWCHYSKIAKSETDLDELKKPYILMGNILKKQKRDIVFNICQYGMGNVWEWGAEVGGHSWRTSGDLIHEPERFIDIAIKNAAIAKYNGPGGWNDPDFFLHMGIKEEPGLFTPNEQYTLVSLWSLLAVPLVYGDGLHKIDDFLLSVLCNSEVIEIDQDPLGKCARTVLLGEEAVLFVKDMEDGSKAVGLCNRGEMEIEIAAKWSDLGLAGKQRVRDLWRQKDLGEFSDSFTAKVGRHGTFLIRLWPVK